MRASIIVVTYNGEAYIAACLESLFQEVGLADEVILVDNASTDGCADVVHERWPEVRLSRNVTNLGFATACNQGAQLAKGETLIFLNQDTCVQPGWLKGLLQPLEQDQSAGLVTSKLLVMQKPQEVQACGQELHFTGFVFSRRPIEATESNSKVEQVGAVSGASFAIRRSLWEQLGGFDPLLYMYYEETDLCWRARLAGYGCLYSPDSVVLHDHTSSASLLARTYTERNRLALLLKNWKGATLFLLLPSLALAEIIDWIYMGLVGWEGVWAKVMSLAWLARDLPRILHSRAMVQVGRTKPDWVVLKACTANLMPWHLTGGEVGELLVGICNRWLRMHYKSVLFIAQRLNI